jgi:hypothetical protein
MESINATPMQSLPQCTLDSGLRSMQASNTQWAAISNSEHLDVNLVTEEGDKVTLSLDARDAAAYAAFEQVDADADGSRSYFQGELSVGISQQDFSLAVEGDLNADEQREIRQVLKTLSKMMKNFINGDLKPMLAKAHKLQGLETIAGLEAHMSFERQVVVARQTQTAVVYDPNGAAIEPDAQETHSAPDLSLVKSKADSLAESMAQRFKPPRAHLRRALRLMHRMLRAYRHQMSDLHPSGAGMIDYIRERFNNAVGHSTNASADGNAD